MYFPYSTAIMALAVSFRALVHAKEVDYFEELLQQFFVIPRLVKYPAAVLYFTELRTKV